MPDDSIENLSLQQLELHDEMVEIINKSNTTGEQILEKLDNLKVIIPPIIIPDFPIPPAQDNSDVVTAVGEVKEAISGLTFPAYPETIKIEKPDWYEPTDNKEDTDLLVASLDNISEGLHSYKDPVLVHILDEKGNIINKFGGSAVAHGGGGVGVPQYVDGATSQTDVFGIPTMWNDGGTYRIPSAAKPLPVTATMRDLSHTQDSVKIGDGTDIADVIDSGTYAGIGAYILDGSGNPITSFGGGTQYTEGDVDATITGTATMMEVAGNALQPIQGTVADGLLVNLGTNNDISGTVTADAGTNLNTSALALEAGGNLATIAGKDFATQTTLALIKAKTDNIPPLGQALAAASVPVVLTVAQLTTLTPLTSVAVTNAGTFVVQENGATLTALQLIDDTVYVDDTATHSTGTTKGIGIMGVATPTDTAVNANDIGMFAMSLDRRQLTDSNIQQGDADVTAGNPLQVSLANHAANATAVKVNVASGGIASGAVASGAVASGAFASGSIASGALASGSIATGAIVDALADDAAFTVTTSRVFPSGFFADDASPDSVNEGDIGAARMSLDRIAYSETPFGIMTSGTTDCTNASTGYRITTSSTRVHNFWLQAKGANTGTITYGSSATYASNLMELRPGEKVLLGGIDISLLYFGSTVAGDDINYWYTV